ncbi:MAG: hypothetical protein GYA36_17430 [Veillonellaceae bacterium]|nr:hypothetical protein [Veillonellaceae bacterium]
MDKIKVLHSLAMGDPLPATPEVQDYLEQLESVGIVEYRNGYRQVEGRVDLLLYIIDVILEGEFAHAVWLLQQVEYESINNT